MAPVASAGRCWAVSPDGQPLRRFQTEQAEAFIAHGRPIKDRITNAYIEIAARTGPNDLASLMALAKGMQGGLQPDPDCQPPQP